MRGFFFVLCGAACLLACSRLPATHFYVLSPSGVPARGPSEGGALSVEPLSVRAPYDDERIVYRPGPYRLEFYEYHLWSASPAVQVGDYLREALASSRRFRNVTRDVMPGTTAVLGGRLYALEEVDRTETDWVARVDVELTLREPGGELLWVRRFTETEPLDRRHPVGVALKRPDP